MTNMNLGQLVLNPGTQLQLNCYLAKPTQALMLAGDSGIGLGTIARALAHQVAGASVVDIRPTLHNKQKTVIINADDVAGLGQVLRDKRLEALAIVIDGADQTAAGVFERMLKLIEEPVANVYHIFTAHNLAAIPATILSRASLIKVLPPSSAACERLLTGVDGRKAGQIKFIADRRPAAICRLLANDNDFDDRASSFEAAKRFLQAGRAVRLELVDGVTDKAKAGELCGDIAKLLITLSERKVTDDKKIAKRLALLAATAERLNGNGNVRLQLVNLAVNF